MKEVTKFAFQGDIALIRVDSMPKGLEESKDNIVALSETHHHHVAERCRVFKAPSGMELYLQAIGADIDIVHKRDWDTHETIRLLGEPGAIWKIRRQREYTPEGWRMVAD